MGPGTARIVGTVNGPEGPVTGADGAGRAVRGRGGGHGPGAQPGRRLVGGLDPRRLLPGHDLPAPRPGPDRGRRVLPGGGRDQDPHHHPRPPGDELHHRLHRPQPAPGRPAGGAHRALRERDRRRQRPVDLHPPARRPGAAQPGAGHRATSRARCSSSDGTGAVAWQVRCLAPGQFPASLLVGNASSALVLPPCTAAPPPPPPRPRRRPSPDGLSGDRGRPAATRAERHHHPRAAAARCRLGPHRAAHGRHQLGHDGQAQARSRPGGPGPGPTGRRARRRGPGRRGRCRGRRRRRRRLTPSAATATEMRPAANLRAFSTRLATIWARRSGSAAAARGRARAPRSTPG